MDPMPSNVELDPEELMEAEDRPDPEDEPPPRRSNRALLVALVALAAVGVAAMVWAVFGRTPSVPTPTAVGDESRVAELLKEARDIAAEWKTINPPVQEELDLLDKLFDETARRQKADLDRQVLEGTFSPDARNDRLYDFNTKMGEARREKVLAITGPAKATAEKNTARIRELHERKGAMTREWQAIYDRHPEWPPRALTF